MECYSCLFSVIYLHNWRVSIVHFKEGYTISTSVHLEVTPWNIFNNVFEGGWLGLMINHCGLLQCFPSMSSLSYDHFLNVQLSFWLVLFLIRANWIHHEFVLSVFCHLLWIVLVLFHNGIMVEHRGHSHGQV
jgi:hypothetical protein